MPDAPRPQMTDVTRALAHLADRVLVHRSAGLEPYVAHTLKLARSPSGGHGATGDKPADDKAGADKPGDDKSGADKSAAGSDEAAPAKKPADKSAGDDDQVVRHHKPAASDEDDEDDNN